MQGHWIQGVVRRRGRDWGPNARTPPHPNECQSDVVACQECRSTEPLIPFGRKPSGLKPEFPPCPSAISIWGSGIKGTREATAPFPNSAKSEPKRAPFRIGIWIIRLLAAKHVRQPPTAIQPQNPEPDETTRTRPGKGHRERRERRESEVQDRLRRFTLPPKGEERSLAISGRLLPSGAA